MEERASDDQMVKDIKAELRHQLDHYFVKYKFTESDELKAATTLDPIYKSLNFFNTKPDEKKVYRKAAAELVKKLDRDPAPAAANNDEEEPRDDDFDMFFLGEKEPLPFTGGSYAEEVDKFCARDPGSFTAFFGANHREFARLGRAACEVLCVPATSVPCERLFSHAEFQVSVNFFYIQFSNL
jgi:hypothetical protein